MRKSINLMFHDVVPSVDSDSSGFPGHSAARYKLEPQQFCAILSILSQKLSFKGCTVTDFLNGSVQGPCLLLTFDDGGASAVNYIVDILDEFGFIGHFFITTDFIDHPSFMTRRNICEIKSRGHIVGSHSCSHPAMSTMSLTEINEEWSRSVQVLSDILGDTIYTASVPGGLYSQIVAKSASCQGIRALFTSEPTDRCYFVDGCAVLGRYVLTSDSYPEDALAIAAGKLSPRLRQWALWNIKKVVKNFDLELYKRIRKVLLERRSPN